MCSNSLAVSSTATTSTRWAQAATLANVGDRDLLERLRALVARDRAITAELLAHIGEVDARKLYLPAAYPSMHLYCVHELRLSEEVAFKRIRAARLAREFPAIFPAVVDGRLNLTSLILLGTHLTRDNVDELLAAAANRTKSEIEYLLAERFPQPDLPTRVQPVAAAAAAMPGLLVPCGAQLDPDPVRPPAQLDPDPVVAPRPKVTPLSPGRIGLQVTLAQSTHDKLRYAQELLGHRIAAGDLAGVLDRAVDALVRELEKTKFAATDRPRPMRRRKSGTRHVPAAVQRAVWERDGGRCTFTSDTGQHCPARGRLEYDHVEPVARGGRATVGNLRLRCRAHNQYEADRTFGPGFMDEKRRAAAEAARARANERAQAAAERARARAAAEEARAQAAAEKAQARAAAKAERERAAVEKAQARAAAEARAAAAEAEKQARVAAAERARERDVQPWLRHLGFRADEARRAAAFCETIPDASIEERVRAALRYLRPPRARTTASPPTVPATSASATA